MVEPFNNIRRANYETDLDFLFELVNSTHDKTNRHCPGLKRWGFDKSSEWVRKDIENMWVYREDSSAKEGRDILACICIKVNEDGKACITLLTVHEEHQGKGIGGRLMDFAETFGSKCEVQIWSYHTRVHQFYIKRGYEVTGSLPLTTWVSPEDIAMPECTSLVLLKVHRGDTFGKLGPNEEG